MNGGAEVECDVEEKIQPRLLGRNETFDRFASVLVDAPGLPRRSVLPSLEPQGAGQWFTEGLAGLVGSFAAGLSVSCGNFVHWIMSLAQSSREEISGKDKNSTHRIHVGGYALNGATEQAARLVCALEAVANLKNLRWHTLLPFGSALAIRYKTYQSWCPICLEKWRADQIRIFEPLIWGMDSAPCCPAHGIPLIFTCSHCGRKSMPAGGYGWPGFCGHCGIWLGRPASRNELITMKKEVAPDKLWTSKETGWLLEMLPTMDPDQARHSIQANPRYIVDLLICGNIPVFSDLISCPYRTVIGWCEGVWVPQFASVIKIARVLNLPVGGFYRLSGFTEIELEDARKALAKVAIDIQGRKSGAEIKKIISGEGDAISGRANLLESLQLFENSSPRAHSPSTDQDTNANSKDPKKTRSSRTRKENQIGKGSPSDKSTGSKLGEPKKTRRGRICEVNQIQKGLERSLSSNIPQPIAETAAAFGYSGVGYVRRRFPELCRAIVQKRRAVGAPRVGITEKRKSALNAALHESPPPTLNKVCRAMGYSSIKALRQAAPEMGEQIARRRNSFQEQQMAEMRAELNAALAEQPVPSLSVVLRRSDLSRTIVKRYMPDLARKIVAKHRISAK